MQMFRGFGRSIGFYWYPQNRKPLGCRIKERVAAGIKSAQKNGTRSGKPIGRPKTIVDRDRVVELRDSGASWATIASAYFSYGTRTAAYGAVDKVVGRRNNRPKGCNLILNFGIA